MEALDEMPWSIGDIKHHWGPAYIIYTSAGWHCAKRRDDPSVVLTAPTADGLVKLIRLDYAACPVPR